MAPLPDNLQSLYHQEENLRGKAQEIVDADARIALHLRVIEHAMNLANLLRQVPTDDEDYKVVQLLGMRTFNAFGASLNLALSGYGQTSASILRDILETVFLLDLFDRDRAAITRWRTSDDKARNKEFRPVLVRQKLDARCGQKGKRDELYKLLSELAVHPTMKSAFMMRPKRDGDAVIGPFIERTGLKAVLSEMDKLAMQVGSKLGVFVPRDFAVAERAAFLTVSYEWLVEFYGVKTKPDNNAAPAAAESQKA